MYNNIINIVGGGEQGGRLVWLRPPDRLGLNQRGGRIATVQEPSCHSVKKPLKS